jgi:putative metal-binding protein
MRPIALHELVPKTAVLLLLFFLVATSAGAREAPSLYLVDSQFGDMQTRIFRVDTSSGALELRADLGTAYTPVLAMAAAGRNVFYLAGTDTGPGNLCQGNVACLLLRVELDPLSPAPILVQVIGTITEGGAMRAGITGLTFRQDGNLYATSQDTSGLYLLDPATAVLTWIGTVDVELHGGDITFDASDRLWLWTNIGAGDGLYQVDPVSAHATLFDLMPYQDMAGMAAVGHGNKIQGTCPVDDHLYEMDPATGLTGNSVPLTLGGAPFNSQRGDLDSPFCEEDAACEDGNLCTSDGCTPGGCRHSAVPNGTACDDGNACTVGDDCQAGSCVPGPLPDGDGDGYVTALCGGTDCDDAHAAVHPDAPEINDGLDNQCPGDFGYGSIDEISGLSGFTIPGDPTQFCWAAQAGATEYAVVRSADPTFSRGCVRQYRPTVCWNDDMDPSIGSVFYYLVRSSAPYTGSWGKDSSGRERTAPATGGRPKPFIEVR